MVHTKRAAVTSEGEIEPGLFYEVWHQRPSSFEFALQLLEGFLRTSNKYEHEREGSTFENTFMDTEGVSEEQMLTTRGVSWKFTKVKFDNYAELKAMTNPSACTESQRDKRSLP